MVTTIAYKDGVVAYDSRMTAGSTIVDDDANKMMSIGNIHMFVTGTSSDYKALLDAYVSGEGKCELECNAIFVDNGYLFKVGCEKDGKVWKCPLESDRPYALGSGEDHAWTAMDMGATAKEAVEMAAKRDIYTGGVIREFRIDGTKEKA